MESFLSLAEKQALLDAHKACKQKRYADRIKTILHLNDGEDYQTISAWLLLGDSAFADCTHSIKHFSNSLASIRANNLPIVS